MTVQEVHISTHRISATIFLVVFILIYLSTIIAFGKTYKSGAINSSQRWISQKSPYIISGDITIKPGAKLTIDPGCELMFSRNASLVVEGSLSASGTSSDNIIFGAENPNAGKNYWQGIIFSNASGSNLNYCRISNTGAGDNAAINLEAGSSPSIRNCFLDDNHLNGVRIGAGNKDHNITLNALTLPYIITEDVIIEENRVLKITPGVVIKMEYRTNLIIKGGIDAVGSSSARIYITSLKDDNIDGIDAGADGPSSGRPFDWGGLLLDGAADSYLKFVDIRYGGGSSLAQNSLLLVDNCSPVVEFCRFSESENYGVVCRGESAPDFGGGHSSAGYNQFAGFSPSKYAFVNKTRNNIHTQYCCWGRNSAGGIESITYDSLDRNSYGKILFEPFMAKCNLEKPDRPQPVSPANGDENIDPPIEFVWNSVPMADHYHLHAARDSGFSDIFLDINFIEDTIAGGLEDKYSQRIYWRCRAANEKGYGDWSEVWQFTTYDTSKPPAPEIIYPAEGQEGVALEANFQWHSSESAEEYHIIIASDEGDILDTIIAANKLKAGGMLPARNYVWRVAGINSNGRGDWSKAKFSTVELFSESDIVLDFPDSAVFEICDLDRDGLQDIVACGPVIDGTPETRVYINRGGYFEISPLSPGLKNATIGIEDFDGDTDPDILIAGYDPDGSERLVFFENRYGRFYDKDIFAGVNIADLAAIDIDSDMDMDFLAVIDGNIRLFENQPQGFVLQAETFADGEYSRVIAAELNCDGREDVILVGNNEGRYLLEIYFRSGAGFQLAQSITAKNLEDIDLSFWDNDAMPDLLLVSDKLEIYPNSSKTFYVDSKISYDGIGSVIPADLDMDNTPEALIIADKMQFFNGKSDVTISEIRFSSAGIIDYDGDYTPDIIAVRNNKAYIFRNNSPTAEAPPKPGNIDFSFEGNDLRIEWQCDTTRRLGYDCRLYSGENVSEGTASANSIARLGGSCHTEFTDIPSGEYTIIISSENRAHIKSAPAFLNIVTPDLRKNVPAEWKYQLQTGENTIVLMRSDLSEKLDGKYDIRTGDALGAFYVDSAGLHCGGYAYWSPEKNIALTIWGDNTQTHGKKDGFDFGDRLRFKLWDSQQSQEIPLKTIMESGYNRYIADTVSVVGGFDDLDKRRIALKSGEWKLCAAAIDAFDPLVDEIFPNGINFLNKNGKSLSRPELFDPARAYMMRSGVDNTIEIRGYELNSAERILRLPGGMSLVPYYPEEGMPISDAFTSIADNLICAIDSRGKIFLPEYNYDEIIALMPGEGYQLFLKMPDTLIYPNALSKTETPVKKDTYEKCTPWKTCTGRWTVFIIEGDILQSGECVRAISDGITIGCGKIDGTRAVLLIWGDDMITDEKDGATEGEIISLELIKEERAVALKPLIAKTYPGDRTIGREFIYNTNELKRFAVAAGPNAIKDHQEGKFSITVNNNPFEKEVRITAKAPHGGRFNLAIYDLMGRMVFSHNEYISAGMSKEVIGKTGNSPGIYFLRAVFNGDVINKKIIRIYE